MAIAGVAPRARSPDPRAPLALVYMVDRDDGVHWWRRVLVHRVTTLSEMLDFNDIRHLVLRRGEPFPGVTIGAVFGIDPIPVGELTVTGTVDPFAEEKYPDWPVRGSRVCFEYFQSIAIVQGNRVTYESDWRVASRFPPRYSLCVYGHENITELPQPTEATEEFNLQILVCLDRLVRRQIQINIVDVVLDSGANRMGRASGLKFKE